MQAEEVVSELSRPDLVAITHIYVQWTVPFILWLDPSYLMNVCFLIKLCHV